MAIQFSAAVNAARLDAFEATVGATAHIKLYSGTVPASCAAAATGTLLADITLPADWLNAASSNTKTKLGTWVGAISTTGTVGYFRVTDAAGTSVGMQGTVGLSAADLVLDDVTVEAGQTFTMSAFTLNAANL